MSSIRETRDLLQVVRQPALRLIKLAEYHARSVGEVRSERDIFAELLTAFWLGELSDIYSTPSSKIDRFDILRGVTIFRNHPGFTLVERKEDLVQNVVEHPDGSVSIGLKPILLPRDCARWTDEICKAAYSELAKRSIDDLADEVKVVLYGLAIQRQTYGEYCDRAGLPRPAFWFGVGQQSKPGKWSARELDTWIKRIFAGPWKPKADVVAEALQRFPGASQAAIKQAWRASAPAEWRKGGAPSKTVPRGLNPK